MLNLFIILNRLILKILYGTTNDKNSPAVGVQANIFNLSVLLLTIFNGR